MELNEKIFKWLNPDGCWHKRRECETCAPYPCKYCQDGGHRFEENPDYTTDPAAMLELIEAVRARGYGFTMYADPGSQWHAFANSDPNSAYTVERADEGTLPMAVARAVEKLIDAETTTEAKDARFKSR